AASAARRVARRQHASTHCRQSAAEVLEDRLLLSADVGDTFAHAQQIQWGLGHSYVSDQFLGDGDSWDWDVDLFRFSAPAGAHLYVETQPGVDASPVDTGLRLFDNFGND
ncbi:MAG: LEPR-XLL domain-containing protein, partial [Fuerstiella sp.]|nr:LEPR-XLL domain-containing protein [Fuerstiella sp.]